MKSLPWILAGTGIGFVIAYLVLTDPPAPRYATGSEHVDDAADKVAGWGVKQRFGGAGSSLAGKLKEGIGRATGNDDLAGEGVLDQAAGAVKDGAGQLAQAASETIKDLNF